MTFSHLPSEVLGPQNLSMRSCCWSCRWAMWWRHTYFARLYPHQNWTAFTWRLLPSLAPLQTVPQGFS